MAIGGHLVVIDLMVRRFFCDNTSCTAKTFAEQISGVTSPWSLRTVVLGAVVEAIGLSVAGRAGARLAARLGVSVGRDTLLRSVRAVPDHPIDPTPILGIDDFALRRGHVYGTVVVDLVTRRAIDLLADRTSDTVATWLREHPGAEVVCRDRAGAYAEAIRAGAPDAVQVADRWHLWHNLVGAVEQTVIRHRVDLRPPTEPADCDAIVVDSEIDCNAMTEDISDVKGGFATRTRERHTAVQELVARGMSISEIGRRLRLDRRTVRRFARASDVDELLITARTAGRTLITGFEPYLRERFAAGCTDAARLTREITERGYRGSDKTVRRFL